MATFAVIFNCSICADTGVIFASNVDEWSASPYAFKCHCERGKLKSMPELPNYSKWIPEHTDKRPTASWFDEMFSKPNIKENEEFKRRLTIWGREFFESAYKDWQARETSKKQLQDFIHEST